MIEHVLNVPTTREKSAAKNLISPNKVSSLSARYLNRLDKNQTTCQSIFTTTAKLRKTPKKKITTRPRIYWNILTL